MTNTEIIEKIRAEIERRITDNTFGAKLELIDILAWLNTLESEKPMNQDGLEEEINRYLEPIYADDIQFEPFTQMTKCARHFAQWGEHNALEHLRVARRTEEAYQEVAKEMRKQIAESGSSEIPKDLDAYAQRVEGYYDVGEERGYLCTHRGDIKDAVIAGAKWQADNTPLPEDTVLFNKGVEEGKRLMMEDAVEAEVESFSYMHPEISIPLNPIIFKTGDKIRVIILPKEN